jgi:hypothetical protein
MKVLSLVALSLFLSFALSTEGRAQPVPTGALPPPVFIHIQNSMQETNVWCWAAVAQQIIRFKRGPGATPPQCALVAIANGSHPGVCCVQQHPACVRTGSIPQIQALVAHFGGAYAHYAPPTNPAALYQTLSSGRPVIVQLRTGLMSSHVVVLTGMSWVNTGYGPQALLHINDPLAFFTAPVPFSRIAPIWMDALVIN